MKIYYRKSEFLKSLFPNVDINDNEAMSKAINHYMEKNGVHVEVSIEGEIIIVEIDSSFENSFPPEFHKATTLCSQGKFVEARPIFEKLINQNPTVSEYYRNFAQTYEEEGEHEKAIDILIDALKWDPKNHWALILMGNIHARYYDDVQTAMTYYDQVMEADPNNFIAVNNIGGAFLQSGKLNLAERYLTKAYQINSKYPNITLGLGLLNLQKGDLVKSFDFAIETLKNDGQTDGQVYKTALKLAQDSAQHLIKRQMGKEALVDFINEIEELTGKEIQIQEDPTLPTAAKVEIAENHGRHYHKILNNPKYPNTDHLIAHELVHLKLAEEARKGNNNQLFIVKKRTFESFEKAVTGSIRKLQKKGIPSESIEKYTKDLFEGILRQAFNAPIDLFIEDILYKDYPELKYVQFISLYQLNLEYHKAVNDPKIIELSPPDILTKSRIYNVVTARHFEDLFGVKMEKQYVVRPLEKDQIDLFWDEFKEYRHNRKPGEEYELVQHWAEDLELDGFFELADEKTYRSKTQASTKAPEDFLQEIEEDPMQLNDLDEFETEELRKFKEQHFGKDINMAVAMYMVGAMEHFKGMEKEKIRDIAFEIAMLGRSGISPEKKGYKLNKIPGKVFSGYKLLAYYYVSWAVAIPEMLQELQMPFEKEYELAKTLYR
jgi:tetratricopeptide (TPR) repeat protein